MMSEHEGLWGGEEEAPRACVAQFATPLIAHSVKEGADPLYRRDSATGKMIRLGDVLRRPSRDVDGFSCLSNLFGVFG